MEVENGPLEDYCPLPTGGLPLPCDVFFQECRLPVINGELELLRTSIFEEPNGRRSGVKTSCLVFGTYPAMPSTCFHDYFKRVHILTCDT